MTGYLNLLANGIDNFTHGLAVAGSFLVSTRVGLLTTAAILLHEIPHEVADFAILLRAGMCTVSFFFFFVVVVVISSGFITGHDIVIKIAVPYFLGFGRWDAAKAQLGTATIGIAGAMTALISNGSDLADGRITSWILPFTAGGFLHIALVTGKTITFSSIVSRQFHWPSCFFVVVWLCNAKSSLFFLSSSSGARTS